MNVMKLNKQKIAFRESRSFSTNNLADPKTSEASAAAADQERQDLN